MLNKLMHKIATELPDQQQFEQDFSNIALTFLKDRAPGLMDYLIGFEIVERPEDGDKAVGILGFLVGDRPVYVPAFWANNQLTGMDLLFDRKQDQFYPLTESWVNRLTSTSGDNFGWAERPDQHSVRSPRFNESIIHPPGTQRTKRAAAEFDSENFKMAWVDMQHSVAHTLVNDPQLQADIDNGITSVQKKYPKFAKVAASNLTHYLTNHGGPEAVKSLLNTITKSAELTDSTLAFYDMDDLCINQFAAELKPKTASAKQPKLLVLTADTIGATTKEAEDIMRDGFAIRDGRDDDQVGEGYNITSKQTYKNPTDNGIHKVRLPGGETRECFVSSYDYLSKYPKLSNPDEGSIIVFDNYDKPTVTATVASTKDIFVDTRDVPQEDERDALWNKALDCHTFKSFSYNRKDKSEDKRYRTGGSPMIALVNKQGKVLIIEKYAPELIKTVKNGDSTQVVAGWNSDTLELKLTLVPGLRNDEIRRIPDKSWVVASADHWRMLIIEPSETSPIHSVGLMPELNKLGYFDAQVKRAGVNQGYVISNNVGNKIFAKNLQEAVYKTAASFTIPADFAYTMIKKSHDGGTVEFMYKSAAFTVAPEDPGIPPSGYDTDVNAVVQPNYSEELVGSTHASPQPDTGAGSGINIYQPPGGSVTRPSAWELAQQAAESGQQQVFDHASIGSLAINYSVTEVVDSYVVDMYKTMDRLGRIIFLLHWSPEDFSERYGSDDLEILKNKIRTVFKGLGDLILKLHQSSEEVNTSGMSVGE